MLQIDLDTLLFLYLTLSMRSAHKKEALLTLPVFAASKRNDQQENKKISME